MIDQLINLLNQKLVELEKLEVIYKEDSLKAVNSGKNIVSDIEALDNRFLAIYAECKAKDVLKGDQIRILQEKVQQVMARSERVKAMEETFKESQKFQLSEAKQKIKNVKVSPRNLEKYKHFSKK